MTTESTDALNGPQINIFLVAHTNVGKTTLIRTLLGKDVGDIIDEPVALRVRRDFAPVGHKLGGGSAELGEGLPIDANDAGAALQAETPCRYPA